MTSPFAPPGVLVARVGDDADAAAEKAPGALHGREDLEVAPESRRRFPSPGGVEVERVRREAVHEEVVDVVEEEIGGVRRFVCEDDARALSERHRREAVEGPAFRTCEEGRFERGGSREAEAEEVGKRRRNGGRPGAIPVHIKPHRAKRPGRLVLYGHPDARDHALALRLHERTRLAGLEVVAGGTLGALIAHGGGTRSAGRVFEGRPARTHSARTLKQLEHETLLDRPTRDARP